MAHGLSFGWLGSLALIFCVLGCNAPKSSKRAPLRPFAQTEKGIQNSDFIQILQNLWPNHSSSTNFRQHGLEVLLALYGQPTWFNYRDNPIIRRFEMQFVNLGPDGFFMGRKSVGFAAMLAAPPQRFSTVVAPQTSALEGLIRNEIPPETWKAFAGPPQEGLLTRCRTMGVLREHGLFLIPGPNQRECLLSRFPDDERFPEDTQRSALICYQRESKNFRVTRFDQIHSLYPSFDEKHLIIYESSYTPPRVSRLRWDDFSVDISPQNPGGLWASHKTVQQLPQGELGLYRCENPQATPSYVHIDSTVFEGKRSLVSQESAWVVDESLRDVLAIRRLSWAAVEQEFPDIDRFPSPACFTSSVFDLKCGISVLKSTITLLETPETLTSPQLLLLWAALSQVELRLPQWLLRHEVRWLGNRVRETAEKQRFPRETLQKFSLSNFPKAPKLRGEEPAMHQTFRSYLGAAPEYWRDLDQELGLSKSEAEHPPND